MKTFAFLLPIAALLAVPASAAEDPPAITVQKRQETHREAVNRATTVVRSLGVSRFDASMAIWTDPICFKAVGLPEDQAAYVTKWFKQIATDAGATIDKHERCDTNLVFTFVSDGKDFMKLISQKRVRTLDDLYGPQVRHLLNGEEPVRWWFNIGQTDGRVEGARAGIETGGAQDSHIRAETSRSILAATVVIDTNRAKGLKLWAVTQYAAFVALSAASYEGTAHPGSIFNLFQNPDRDSEMSQTDQVFLKELYRMDHSRDGMYQRGKLVGAMVKGMVKP